MMTVHSHKTPDPAFIAAALKPNDFFQGRNETATQKNRLQFKSCKLKAAKELAVKLRH